MKEIRDINDVLSGHVLSEKAIEELTVPIGEITQSILNVFEHFMPVPLTNILKSVVWKESVYSNIDDDNKHFKEAAHIFERRQFHMSIIDFMEHLAEKDGSQYLFRECDTFQYMSIAESLEWLKKWLKYQYGIQGWTAHVKDIWMWLVRTQMKKGVFEVIGPPNSGKSSVYGALLSLFVSVGYCRPNKDCQFNWDHVIGKVIICAEECNIGPKDTETREFLKDALAANPAILRRKGQPQITMDARPWLFLTNWDNFESEKTGNDNPFNSRLYRYRVKQFNGWVLNQPNIHPYAWLRLLQEFGYL